MTFRTFVRCALVALGCSAISVVPAAAQNGSDPFGGVRELVQRLMLEQNLPSISIAVADDGEIVWEEAFGWADREARIEATPHTMYSLASISKPITATGLMILQERGAVDLDRPIDDYLGAGKVTGYAGEARQATVRRVLNHTAGLPLHYQFFYEDGGYDVPTMDETIARYAIIANPPGRRVQYSNLGFGMIDYLITRLSGVPYPEFMRTEVFLPLGMTRTSVGLPPALAPHAAVRYDSRDRRVPFYDFDHPGASAVWSSAHDLVRFGMAHLGHTSSDQRPVITEETRRAMQTVTSPTTTGSGYGISWNTNVDDNGFRRVSHTGGMPGVSTVLNLYPDEGIVIVVLANKNASPVSRIAQEVAASMLPRYATALRERQAAAQQESQRPPAFTTPPELAGVWTGTLRTYDTAIPLEIEFQPDGDVHVRLQDQLETLLNNASWREGNLTGRFAGTVPTPDAGRHRHSILLNLWLENGRLRGQASAQTTQDPVYFALTSWVDLSRR